MSGTRFSLNPDEYIHKPISKRNVSGELDVFEATRYFSEFNEPTVIESSPYVQKQSIVRDQRQNRVHPETERRIQKQSSMTPTVSRKLKGFLNSLIRSVGSKKSKPTTADRGEIPDGGWWKRRRRSSISHIQSKCAGDSACEINAPRKSFDSLANYFVDKHVVSSYRSFKSTISTNGGLVLVGKQGMNSHVDWLEEKLKSQRVWCETEKVQNGGDGEGYESDSSSDLFELNVCDAKVCDVKS